MLPYLIITKVSHPNPMQSCFFIRWLPVTSENASWPYCVMILGGIFSVSLQPSTGYFTGKIIKKRGAKLA